MIGDAAAVSGAGCVCMAAMADEELVGLGRNMADLTEMAQEVLKAELATAWAQDCVSPKSGGDAAF